MPVFALIVANIIWGAASPIFKWSLQTTPLFTLAFIRFYIAAFILFLFLRSKIFNFDKHDFPKIFLVGFFGVSLNITFFFFGLKTGKAINAPVIASTQPLIIFILAVFTLGEKIKLNKLIGLFLGALGIGLIVGVPALQRGYTPEIIGDFLIFLATLAAVGQTIVAKKLMNDHQKLDPFVLTFWMFLIGTVTFFPFMLPEIIDPGFSPDSLLQTQPLIGIIFGSIFSSLIAYCFYIYGLSKITAQESSIFTYIDPIAGVLIAVPLLGETITWEFVVGSLLIFGGIWVAEHRIHYHPFYKLKNKK